MELSYGDTKVLLAGVPPSPPGPSDDGELNTNPPTPGYVGGPSAGSRETAPRLAGVGPSASGW